MVMSYELIIFINTLDRLSIEGYTLIMKYETNNLNRREDSKGGNHG